MISPPSSSPDSSSRVPSPLAQPDRRHFEPLWDRIDRNRWRLAGYSAVFVIASVASLNMMLGALAFVVWVVSGLVAAARGSLFLVLTQGVAFPWHVFGWSTVVFTGMAVLWVAIALSRSEKWLIDRLGATLVPAGDLTLVKSGVKDMSIAAGMQVAPAFYVLETPNVNAFVISAHQRRAVLGMTRGMIERLSLEEQRAVTAHLIALLRSGDTIVSTGVTALMMPLHAWRDWMLVRQDDPGMPEVERQAQMENAAGPTQTLLVIPLAIFGIALTILAELIAAGHRELQLKTAEKADAEGMLLLKQPRVMLDAVEKCVRFNNNIKVADDAFGQLFYCWPGDSSDDEYDPEWRRVARLREVLGVEGFRQGDEYPHSFYPTPPRLDAEG